MNYFLISILLLCAILVQIEDSSMEQSSWERPIIEFPEDNPYSDASIELGGALFSENLFSRDTSISCRSCHLTSEAFADHLPLGEGIQGRHVTRNTPTLLNIGFHPYFMIDGKFESLEDQVLGPIVEHNEFDMTPELVVQRLRALPYYNKMSQAAYQEDISIEVIQKALANFQRVLISDDAPFDDYMRGESQLSPEALHGWTLFKSDRLGCISCHNGYNFTNYSFQNNGLYEVYKDAGRALITENPSDEARFKVPTLRNIMLTYPYMHDGSMKTIDEVIDHYASGGKNHPSKSEGIRGFELTKEERAALVAFFHSLTGAGFLDTE